MAVIKLKALVRAAVFDIGWRMIKLAGFKYPTWDWSEYWHREILDRAAAQLDLLEDPSTPEDAKGWIGAKK